MSDKGQEGISQTVLLNFLAARRAKAHKKYVQATDAKKQLTAFRFKNEVDILRELTKLVTYRGDI